MLMLSFTPAYLHAPIGHPIAQVASPRSCSWTRMRRSTPRPRSSCGSGRRSASTRSIASWCPWRAPGASCSSRSRRCTSLLGSRCTRASRRGGHGRSWGHARGSWLISAMGMSPEACPTARKATTTTFASSLGTASRASAWSPSSPGGLRPLLGLPVRSHLRRRGKLPV